MKSALCGYGTIGKVHYNNIMNNPNFNIEFVVDVNDLKLNVPVYKPEQMEEKLKEHIIKCLFVCSPTIYHYETVKIALMNKVHVFVEKPICNDIMKIKELYSIANDNNCILFCGFNRRFDPNLQQLYRKYRSGQLEKVTQGLVISRDFPYPSNKYISTTYSFYHDSIIHDIDYIVWLLGELPISVNSCGTYIKPIAMKYKKYDNVTTILQFKSGNTFTIISSRLGNTYQQTVKLMGLKETLSVDIKSNGFIERYKESYKNIINAFYKSIMEKNSIITNTDIINTHTIIDACIKSSKENKTITINYENKFRNYDKVLPDVIKCYADQRIFQNLDYYDYAINKYCSFEKKATFWELFDYLKVFVDLSDPDINLTNHQHLFQTAEGLRKDGFPDWMQLVGLIHDLGKIIYRVGNDSDGTSMTKQWAIVGDTFILGCKIPDSIVFPNFNKMNKHYNDTKTGIYIEGCGFDNLKCSFGHDEYLYRLLKHNMINLPEEAFYIIRYHSLYLWHKENEYHWFENEKDTRMKWWVSMFQKYDLYTKCNKKIDEVKARKYYNNIVNKYFPKYIYW